MINPSRTPRSGWLIAAAGIIVSVVVGACAAGQAGWTYDPSIGVPTAAAGSAGASSAPSAEASLPGSPVPSAAGIPGASSSPGGAVINLVAKNVKFDQSQLTASANTPFTINFDNQDAGIPHNVAIYTDKSATTNLFRGATVTGPGTQAYAVPALQPGTYYFQCDVHPSIMNGTFTVK